MPAGGLYWALCSIWKYVHTLFMLLNLQKSDWFGHFCAGATSLVIQQEKTLKHCFRTLVKSTHMWCDFKNSKSRFVFVFLLLFLHLKQIIKFFFEKKGQKSCFYNGWSNLEYNMIIVFLSLCLIVSLSPSSYIFVSSLYQGKT